MATSLSFLVVALFLGIVPAQNVSPPTSDVDLRAHLETLAKTLDDATLAVGNRERVALDMAATLDRAALSTPDLESRRSYWSEAATTLDRFSERNVGHPMSQSFRVQATVYLWARARTWLQVFQLNFTDSVAKAAALKNLKECTERFEFILTRLPSNANDNFAQNVRYRTAQAMTDLAEILPDEAARIAKYAEARRVIDSPITEESLAGFAELLRGILDTRLGAFEKARAEIAAAAASKAAPPIGDLLDAKLDLLLGSRDFEAALKEVNTAAIENASRPALRVRVLLAQRAGTADILLRNASETAVFEELARLTSSTRGDDRAALLSTAQAILEPSSTQDARAWERLASGAALLGNPSRAGDLSRKGAIRAESSNNPNLSTELFLKAGAFYFQAEKFVEADALLSRVIDNPQAGSARARAGILRVLSRGRALALKQPGASEESYLAALKQQIKSFPDDPSTSEARWLLGKLWLAQSDRVATITQWKAISHGQSHWLESRRELADMMQKELDIQRSSGDRAVVEKALNEARAFFRTSLGEAQGELETNEILLCSARLELTPKLGKAPEAVAALERVRKSAATAQQRDAARRLMILALAMSNRWVEVEQLARQEAQESSVTALIGLVRLIDRAAAEADSDLKMRRLGVIERLLLSRTSEKLGELDPALRAEIYLRQIRALLFSGDEATARRTVSSGRERLPTNGEEELRDLAETYMKLGAFELAIEVQRLRIRAMVPGSSPWFEARYSLALASYRAGKPKEALQLIEATEILHPDLGGGELREKFTHLRLRIGPGNP